jgi:predicted nucleic acid-binding protein
MSSAGRAEVLLDTSVLINFLNIDRLDLLTQHPDFVFLITNHVRREITDYYPEQVQRLQDGIASGAVTEIVVESIDELNLFAQLSQSGRLGVGECVVIAAAAVRGIPVAVDDKQAKKTALKHCPRNNVLDTVGLIVSLIHAGLIDVPQADAIKQVWESTYRFRLMFQSFSERI